MNQARWATPDLQSLVDLFYADHAELGEFIERDAEAIPAGYRSLLAHDAHMTVTLEAFHECSVNVEVLEVKETPTHYARKIILRRDSDQHPVLFGIVRLAIHSLPENVREEIAAQRTPLGRVLISHNILRTVKLLSLWEIVPSNELKDVFQLNDHPQSVFGRTALIYCDGLPAVELLEIAAIEPDGSAS